MTTLKKTLLIIGAVVVIGGAVALVTIDTKTTEPISEDTDIATSTPEDTSAVPDVNPVTENTNATTQETPALFDMEPVVPKAKVSTEGWKTCRNEEYGYEFKFPGRWNVYTMKDRSNYGFERTATNCGTYQVVFSDSNQISTAPETIVASVSHSISDSTPTGNTIKIYMIEDETIPMLQTFSKDKLVVKIQGILFSLYSNDTDVFESILSTVQIFTPTQTNATQALLDPKWLTYEDEHIRFTYPERLCGTTLQEHNSVGWCDMLWGLKRIDTELPTYVMAVPGSSAWKEFGGNIYIEFITYEDYKNAPKETEVDLEQLQEGYEVYTGKFTSEGSDAYWVTDGNQYVQIITNHLPESDSVYLPILLKSIEIL